MASVEKISELLSRPQVISEIAKSLKDGTCEVKIENGLIVIVQIKRSLQYKN